MEFSSISSPCSFFSFFAEFAVVSLFLGESVGSLLDCTLSVALTFATSMACSDSVMFDSLSCLNSFVYWEAGFVADDFASDSSSM